MCFKAAPLYYTSTAWIIGHVLPCKLQLSNGGRYRSCSEWTRSRTHTESPLPNVYTEANTTHVQITSRPLSSTPLFFHFPLAPLMSVSFSLYIILKVQGPFVDFSEQQFSPSKGQGEVQFCLDDSKWNDYRNERQLFWPHPSITVLSSTHCLCSSILGYSLFHSTCTLFVLLCSPSSLCPPPFNISTLYSLFFNLSLLYSLHFTSQLRFPAKTNPFSYIFYSSLFSHCCCFSSSLLSSQGKHWLKWSQRPFKKEDTDKHLISVLRLAV